MDCRHWADLLSILFKKWQISLIKIISSILIMDSNLQIMLVSDIQVELLELSSEPAKTLKC